MPKPMVYVRRLHELLLSVYVALLILLEESTKDNSKLQYVTSFLLWLHRFMYHVGHPGGGFPGARIYGIEAWSVIATPIFVFLCILGRLALLTSLLRYVTGVIAVAGFPLIWMGLQPVTGPSLAVPRWLWIEVDVIVACAILWLYRRSPSNLAWAILVLVLHFGLWSFVALRNGPFGYPWLALLFGICSGLAWGFYVRLSDGFPTAKSRPAR